MNALPARFACLALLTLAASAGCASPQLTFDGAPYHDREVSIQLYGPPDALGVSLNTRVTFTLDAQGTATVPIDGNMVGFGGILVLSDLTPTAFPLLNVDHDQFTSTHGALQGVRLLLRRQLGSSSCFAIVDQVTTAQGVVRTDYDPTQFDTQPCANFRP